MQFELKDVGRRKVCGVVEVHNEAELFKEVQRYLMSGMVDLLWNDSFTEAQVVVGGFRAVGKVFLLSDAPVGFKEEIARRNRGGLGKRGMNGNSGSSTDTEKEAALD